MTPTCRWGIEARVRAFLSEGEAAERLYRESIDRLGAPACAPSSPALTCSTASGCAASAAAQTHARNSAPPTCSTDGHRGFRRAAPAPVATGGTARKRTPETSSQLTAQEEQVARMARDGLIQPEIGARLFISARRSSTTWEASTSSATTSTSPTASLPDDPASV